MKRCFILCFLKERESQSQLFLLQFFAVLLTETTTIFEIAAVGTLDYFRRNFNGH